MVERRALHFRFAACVAIVLFAAALASLTLGSFGSAPPATRDDWRRTANGWERATAWPKSTALGAANHKPQVLGSRVIQARFDTHPAALALMQLVGSLAALAAFAFPTRGKNARIDWKTVLSRSFRASVFGD